MWEQPPGLPALSQAEGFRRAERGVVARQPAHLDAPSSDGLP
jgi:hypothetical protein